MGWFDWFNDFLRYLQELWEEIFRPKVEVTEGEGYLKFKWNNDLNLELNIVDDEIKGIGEVKLGNVKLRGSTVTERPTIEKIEDGEFVEVPYDRWEYIGYTVINRTVQISTKCGDIEIQWYFEPSSETVERNEYEGIAYKFFIQSPFNISHMEFISSWELNGDITDKTLLTRWVRNHWMRKCSSDDEFQYRANHYFHNTQPPTYQYDSTGSLSSYLWPPKEVEHRLEKEVDSKQLIFKDKFDFGSYKQIETPYRIILYSDNADINEYTYLYDKLSEKYRDYFDLKEVELVPVAFAHRYIRQRLGPQPPGVPPHYREAVDNELPALAEKGFKAFMILSPWISNGRIGEPDANRLATHDIEVYPDDVEDFKYFINKIHDMNMKLYVWLSACYSKVSPLYVENPDWKVTDVDGSNPGAASGDVYVMSYNSGYYSYAINKLKEIYNEFGFDGIWHDSFSGSSRTDYGKDIITTTIGNQIRFLQRLQETGYVNYTESLSIFGQAGLGSTFITPPDAPKDRDIGAQFNGREYLAYKTAIGLPKVDDYPLNIDYYKFIANKGVPPVDPYQLTEDELEYIAKVNKDYNAVCHHMKKRELLDDNGVLWYDGDTRIIFAYTEFDYVVENGIVYDITDGVYVDIPDMILTTQEKHTYKIR